MDIITIYVVEVACLERVLLPPHTAPLPTDHAAALPDGARVALKWHELALKWRYNGVNQR